MAYSKRKWAKPFIHKIPALDNKLLDEVATLSDERLQEYSNANGFWLVVRC
ncbi:MAG: hypothetical protein LUH07_15535 [Lachnospiraceae bacterium]|nr:hypothetical protein [Lachnospiraceae bacterium]